MPMELAPDELNASNPALNGVAEGRPTVRALFDYNATVDSAHPCLEVQC